MSIGDSVEGRQEAVEGKSWADATRAKEKEYLFSNVGHYYKEPLMLVRGEGKHVWDAEGRQYLDAFGGILTISVGHANPRVNEGVIRQLQALQHTTTQYVTAPQADLAERLAAITPGDLQRSFFSNSGTEANETALIVARLHAGSDDVIVLRHSYHGRSALAMTLTGNAGYKALPSLPGVHHLANPYCYRCPFGLTYPSCELRCAKDLEAVIQTATNGRPAAFMAEPIQGTAGFITPPPEYFKEVVAIVRKYGGVFICDEVQTAWGRTGTHLWGIEHWGVVPDIMTSAKGMANGFPIGWTITTDEIASDFKTSTISTFGGNPVAMAAAGATLDVILEDGLADNAERAGGLLKDGLRDLQEKYACIGDVRGMGLMVGVEFVHGGKRIAPDLMQRFLEATREEGVLVGVGGLKGNVARIAPHLNCTVGDIGDMLRAFDAALEQVQPFMET